MANLLRGLGELRKNNFPVGKLLQVPVLSLNQLDDCVVQSGITLPILVQHGYDLPEKRYRAAHSKGLVVASGAGGSAGGRPSLVNSGDIQNLVRETLEQNTIDSERVVVSGRGDEKQLVLAKHLSKKLGRIWSETPELREKLSLMSLRRMVRRHFPHIRRPRRETDVCEHCRHLTEKLYPKASRATVKHRREIEAIMPTYFAAFNARPVIKEAKDKKDVTSYLENFLRFVNITNSHAQNDSARDALGRGGRLSLHQAEARANHQLQPHLEILQAYEWHQISARRQGEYLQSLRSGGLPATAGLIQTDFKENIKYPLGPKESAEEWHAQNKLALSVFGAHALVPKILCLANRNFCFFCKMFRLKVLVSNFTRKNHPRTIIT